MGACPSLGLPADYGSNAGFGTFFQLKYAYWGGLAEVAEEDAKNSGYALSIYQFDSYSTIKPAYRRVHRNDADRLLMTDRVVLYRPPPAYTIYNNHPQGDPARVAYQNQLFADGRAEGVQASQLPANLLDIPPYGFAYNSNPGANGVIPFYWAVR
jgi:hypothetical protein